MSVTDELLKNNEAYAASFDKGELPLPQGCSTYDCDGDGAFTVDDYRGQVDPAAGNDEDVARKGGVSKESVLNAMSLEQMLQHLSNRQASRSVRARRRRAASRPRSKSFA